MYVQVPVKKDRTLSAAWFDHEGNKQVKNIKGFTLIELLVVIAVVAVLLTVMMPSLVSAREQARSIYCRSNMKQMCIAASTYSLANRGYYPISFYSSGETPETGTAPASPQADGTDQETSEPTGQSAIYSNCWDFTTISSGSEKRVVPGLLWQGDTIAKVQQCPSYKGTDNWNSDPFSGYNYNTTYIGHGQGESTDASYRGPVVIKALGIRIVLPAKASDVRSPTQCILFGDGGQAGGTNKLMRSPMVWEGDTDWSVRLAGTQSYRHRGQTNIAWADGHVTGQQELYTDTHPTIKSQLEAYNRQEKIKIGFIAPDNSLYDLK